MLDTALGAFFFFLTHLYSFEGRYLILSVV